MKRFPLFMFPIPIFALFFLIISTTGRVWDSFHNLTGCHAGQHADGVAKLKHYFQHFGYINLINPNSTSTNFTDDFDHDLESAIKIYQLNYNLNPTGKLDHPTLQQIVRPRCGVADIVNGTSSMNAGKKPPPPHIHTVAHYSFFPGNPRWLDLTYAFLPENNLSDPVQALYARAFDRWSAVIPMNFTKTTSYSDADIKIGFFRGDHGDGAPFDGPGGILAHAFAPPDGRFHFDADESWAMDASHLNASSFDLESVAMHEMGHMLGLGHSSVAGSVMVPGVAPGVRKVELDSDDIEGIQKLYGSNPNYKKSTPAASDQIPTYWLVCGG